MTKTQELQKSKYDDRLIIESERFAGIAYEIKRRAICAMVWQDGQFNRIYGDIPRMRELAEELIEICDSWESVRT